MKIGFSFLNKALSISLLSGAIFFPARAFTADSDFLGKAQIKISSKKSEVAINRTLGDVRAIFQNYHPAVDSSTSIKSPVRVSGSSTHPFMQVTMEKCVFLFCQTVEMKADITLQDTSGSCTKNFILKADLSRSSETLSNTYDSIDFKVCYTKLADGQGTLDLSGSAHHSRSYSGGIVQGEVYKLLKLQISPIVNATNQVLKSYSADLVD